MTARRLSWLLPAMLLPAMLLPAMAQAHILREANGIEAELHIPPDDKPVAGQSTKLTFAFGSRQHTFALQNCDCQVYAAKPGVTTAASRLRADPPRSPIDAAAYINFPTAGDYQVTLTGSATDGSFSSFKMTYPAHVANPYAVSGSSRTGLWLIAAATLLAGAGILTAVVLQNRTSAVSPERS